MLPIWTFDGTPKAEGWHAVSVCYDPQEGIIPAASYWNGEKWDRDYILAFHDEVFEDKDQAEKWAYDHDMEE